MKKVAVTMCVRELVPIVPKGGCISGVKRNADVHYFVATCMYCLCMNVF